MGRKSFHIIVLVAWRCCCWRSRRPRRVTNFAKRQLRNRHGGPGRGGTYPACQQYRPCSLGTYFWPEVYYVGGFWQASQGIRSLGLKNGSIFQIFTPTLGKMYQVSFDLAGDPTLPPALKSLAIAAPSGTI